MITIKTNNMTISREDNKVVAISPSRDQIYFKFADNIEVIIPMRVTPVVSATMGMIATARAQNITVDFTKDEKSILSFA